jgi:phage recombination protein Bet
VSTTTASKPPQSKALTSPAPKTGALQNIEGWNPENIALIKNTVAKGTTDDELRLFLYTCKHTGLDPLIRQIHSVKRWDGVLQHEVMAIQVGIDGYRLVAIRTGEMDGQEGPYWCDENGDWKDVWLLASKPPTAAKVIVFRKGHAHSYVGIARYDAYVQKKRDGNPNSMWAKMPDGQLAKCAEALALRKAFPNELGGTHTEDELAQVDTEYPAFTEPRAVDVTAAAPVPATPPKALPAPSTATAPAPAPAPAAEAPAPAESVNEGGNIMEIEITPKMVTVSTKVGQYNVTDVNGVVRFTKSVDIAKKCKAAVGQKITVTVDYLGSDVVSEILKVK